MKKVLKEGKEKQPRKEKDPNKVEKKRAPRKKKEVPAVVGDLDVPVPVAEKTVEKAVSVPIQPEKPTDKPTQPEEEYEEEDDVVAKPSETIGREETK
jgi:hypothetical protein